MAFTLIFILLCYQLLTGDLVLLSSADESFSATSVYRQIVSNADPSKNFLLAPQQIEQLVDNLKPTQLDDEASRSNSAQLPLNDIKSVDMDGFSQFQLQPREVIKVLNRLITTAHGDGDDVDEVIHDDLERYKEKLPNARIEYHRLTAKQKSTHHSPNSSVKLINSVTLQARWAFNFQKRDTHKRLFYTTPQTHVYMDSMRKDDIFRYGRLLDLNATAVQLPLQYPDLSLLIVLPFESDGLARLEAQLSDLSVVERIATQRLRPTLVRVLMPKFKFKHNIELGKILEDSQIDVNITKIQHETTIEINEDGLGRIERRTVLFWNAYSSLRTTPQIFDMNHPFFFAIRNNEGIQFVGHLARL